jgi:hypothetical protein
MLTYRDAHSRTEKPKLWACAHTHIHTPHRHPILPILTPMPSQPLSSHLPGPIPSIKLQKQVSQQPGRGKVSVRPSSCPLPHHQALYLSPSPTLV